MPAVSVVSPVKRVGVLPSWIVKGTVMEIEVVGVARVTVSAVNGKKELVLRREMVVVVRLVKTVLVRVDSRKRNVVLVLVERAPTE